MKPSFHVDKCFRTCDIIYYNNTMGSSVISRKIDHKYLVFKRFLYMYMFTPVVCMKLSCPDRLSFIEQMTVHLKPSTWFSNQQTTHVDVIVLNLSCPAVSQICSLIFSPFISIVRILKSTPIVVIYVPTEYNIRSLFHEE